MFKVGNVVKPLSRKGSFEYLIKARVVTVSGCSIKIAAVKGYIKYQGSVINELWITESAMVKSTNTKAYEIF